MATLGRLGPQRLRYVTWSPPNLCTRATAHVIAVQTRSHPLNLLSNMRLYLPSLHLAPRVTYVGWAWLGFQQYSKCPARPHGIQSYGTMDMDTNGKVSVEELVRVTSWSDEAGRGEWRPCRLRDLGQWRRALEQCSECAAACEHFVYTWEESKVLQFTGGTVLRGTVLMPNCRIAFSA